MENPMKTPLLPLTIPLTLCLAAFAIAGAQPSADYGKKLFNDPSFAKSSNAESCNSCHSDGSGLQYAGKNPNLASVINNCITNPMQGEAIDLRSVEMQSLYLYILSLGR